MDSFTCTHCPFDRQTRPDISRFHFLSGKNIPRSSRPDPLPTTGTETPHPRTPKKDGFSTSCGRYRPHEPFFLSAFGKREAGSGKREAGSGKREAGSRKHEAGSWKQEAGSRKLEAGSRKQGNIIPDSPPHSDNGTGRLPRSLHRHKNGTSPRKPPHPIHFLY